jgi:cytochrome c-type biogenesis protein CcmH
MSLFIIIAAAMLIVALLAVVVPLLKKHAPLPSEANDREGQNISIAQDRLSDLNTDLDNKVLTQQQFDIAKLELEQELLFDLERVEEHVGEENQAGRNAAIVVMAAIPLLSILIYMKIGSPEMVNFDPTKLNSTNQAEQMHSVDEMVTALQTRLEKNPEDAEGWYMLGRSMMTMKRYNDAVRSFEATYKLVGDQPAILLAYADAIAMSENGKMGPRAAQLVHRALEIEPNNVTAIWLSGIIAEDSGNYSEALGYFNRLLPMVADKPEDLSRVQFLINRVTEAGGQGSNDGAAETTPSEPAITTSAKVTVLLSISAEMASKVSADAAVFVFAKAAQGPRFPIAAERHQVKDLPLEIVLDDNDAVMDSAKLSNFSEITLGAHVSISGDAMVVSGDLNSNVFAAKVADGKVVKLHIDSVVP